MVFLFLAVFSNISLAQDQYLILHQGMPILTEGAATLKKNEIQWGLGGIVKRSSFHSGLAQINYGVLNNLESFLNIGVVEPGGSDNFLNSLQLGLKYNFNPDEKRAPLVSVSAQYVTRSWNTSNFLINAIATQPFGNFRAHLNLTNYSRSQGGERNFDVGMAVDYNFSQQKFLLLDEVILSNLRDVEYTYRIGAKKQFGNSFLVYMSAGATVRSDFSPSKSYSLGINWYGFDWLGDFK